MVMLYEDAPAGCRAKFLFDELMRAMGPQYEGVGSLWSFQVVGLPDIRNSVASDATAADLVTLSVSGERDLPPEVDEWLEMWIWLLDGKRPALLTLLPGTEGSCVRNIQAKIRSLATSKGLAYFTQSTPDPELRFVHAEREHLAEVAREPNPRRGRNGTFTGFRESMR